MQGGNCAQESCNAMQWYGNVHFINSVRPLNVGRSLVVTIVAADLLYMAFLKCNRSCLIVGNARLLPLLHIFL